MTWQLTVHTAVPARRLRRLAVRQANHKPKKHAVFIVEATMVRKEPSRAFLQGAKTPAAFAKDNQQNRHDPNAIVVSASSSITVACMFVLLARISGDNLQKSAALLAELVGQLALLVGVRASFAETLPFASPLLQT